MVDLFAPRSIPAWYSHARLGLFVHWGPYSVPAWAPPGPDPLVRTQTEDWADVLRTMPAAELWWTSAHVPGSAVARRIGEEASLAGGYERFVADIRGASHDVDVDGWAGAARTAGAGYLVLTTKHHDGFLLWPARHGNPHRPGWHLDRDLVGLTAEACRNAGIRFGAYYSGGLDWTFAGLGASTLQQLQAAMPADPAHRAMVADHWDELIERYRPDIVWNDVAHVAGPDDARALVQRYHAAVPDGVVCGFFGEHADVGAMPLPLVPRNAPGQPFEVVVPMGTSLAWNRAEDEQHLKTVRELIEIIVAVASLGGNVLLGVGPTAHGSIPRLQRERLEGIGSWMAVSGSAVRGASPWPEPSFVTSSGCTVRALVAEGALHLVLFGPVGRALVLPGYALPHGHDVRVVGIDGPVPFRSAGRDLVVDLPDLSDHIAPVLRISPAPALR